MGSTDTSGSSVAEASVTTVIPFCETYTPRAMLHEAVATVDRQEEVDAKTIVVEDDEERGPAWARNVGLAEADTRYVAFLDADDIWDERKLADQLAEMRRTGAGICLEGDTDHSTDAFIEGVLSSEIFGLTSAILVDTERTDARFHEGLERREDHLYMMEVASDAGICFVPDVFEARKYEDGLSKHVDRSREQVDEFYEVAVERVPEASRYRATYYGAALLGLGWAKHRDGEGWLAIGYLLESLRYDPSVRAVGALGLALVGVLYRTPLALLGRLRRSVGRSRVRDRGDGR